MVVVEDQGLMSRALVEMLRTEGMAARATFPRDASELLSELRESPPDVVLLDLDLGRLGDGTQMIEPIVRLGAVVLILTASHDELRHARCLVAGAQGIVSKDGNVESLLESINRAQRGHTVTATKERERLVDQLERWTARSDREMLPFRRLTTREEDVLEAMCRGMAVVRIAEELDVAETTIRTHVRGILSKLGATSQLEAVSMVRQVGWARSAVV